MAYQADSLKAEEFIKHEEILDTLKYAGNKQKQSCADRAAYPKELPSAKDSRTRKRLCYWNANNRT